MPTLVFKLNTRLFRLYLHLRQFFATLASKAFAVRLIHLSPSLRSQIPDSAPIVETRVVTEVPPPSHPNRVPIKKALIIGIFGKKPLRRICFLTDHLYTT